MRACLFQAAWCTSSYVIDPRGIRLLSSLTGVRDELEVDRAPAKQAASAPGSQNGYELGDCFFDRNGMRAGPYGQQHHTEKWPDSLAVAYMNRTSAAGDYDVLAGLVRARKSAPPLTSLVVHLRMGDVLDQAGLPLRAFLDHPQPQCWEHDLREVGLVYAQPLAYYEDLVVPRGVKEVMLVASTTYHAPWETASHEQESRGYIQAVSEVFTRKGHRVIERLNGDADLAFLLCAKAKFFVPSGGGFSTAAATVAERLGGRVLGEPIQWVPPLDAISSCLSAGFSLTSLAVSTGQTAFRMVAIEHLRAVAVGTRVCVLLVLALSVGLCTWRAFRRFGLHLRRSLLAKGPPEEGGTRWPADALTEPEATAPLIAGPVEHVADAG